jgi:hypothetical protein
MPLFTSFDRRGTLKSDAELARLAADQPCSHVCPEHPIPPYRGRKLSLERLDELAAALTYSPWPAAGSGGMAWVQGLTPETPAAYQGGAVERGEAVLKYDPSPLGVATRARRGWLDCAGLLPNGRPVDLLAGSADARWFAELIRQTGVLHPDHYEAMVTP